MKMRFLVLLLLLAALSVGPSGAAEQDTPPSEAEKTQENPPSDAPAEPVEEAAPAEEETAPATDVSAVQEAIEQAEPPVAPTEEEAEAAGANESEGSPAVEDTEIVVEEETVEETAAPAPAPDDSLGAPLDLDTLPTADGLDLPNPDELLPEDVYTPGDDDELAPPPPAMTESKIDRDRRLAIRYQEVKLQALKESAIREMREKADVARTDEAKRQALREYYRLLFAKMVAIDPELAEKCELMETAYMRRVSQFRVMPTIPLQPPPTPEPLPGRAESAPPEGQDS